MFTQNCLTLSSFDKMASITSEQVRVSTKQPEWHKKDIQWSTKSYNMRQFLKKYSHKMPLIVTVCAGYYGETEMETLASDQMMRIHSVCVQKRVFAEVKTANEYTYITIPVDYKVPFDILGDRKGTMKSLSEIIEKKTLPVSIRCSREYHVNFVTKTPSCPPNTLYEQRIEVQDVYDEYYLLVNMIMNGNSDSPINALNEKVLLIPMHLGISVYIAEGLVDGSDEEWAIQQEWLNTMASASKVQYEQVQFNSDIALYKNTDNLKKNAIDLVYKEPTQYIAIFSIKKKEVPKIDKDSKSTEEENERNAILEKTEIKKVGKKVRKQSSMKTISDIGLPIPVRSTGRSMSVDSTVGHKEPWSIPPPLPDRNNTDCETMDATVNSGNQYENAIVIEAIEHHRKNIEKIKAHSASESNTAECDIYEEVDDKKVGIHSPKAELKPESPEIRSTLKREKQTTTLTSTASLQEVEDLKQNYRISSMGEIPSDVANLSIDEVGDCLRMLKMDKYVDVFQEQQVDGELLAELQRDILEEEFGFTSFHAQKLTKFVSGWRPKY